MSISDELMQAARAAAANAYAPYSNFAVGAALLFGDGAIVTGTNVENASYGLSLCAETVAVATAFAQGRRDGLVGVAVTGPVTGPVTGSGAITPCGRCRQVLAELAGRDGADPPVWCDGPDGIRTFALSALLPHRFGGR